MKTFPREDLRLFAIRADNGLRYLVAEFIDEYNEWCMGFFKLTASGYVLMNLPVGTAPSHHLCERLWRLLRTTDSPTLTVPRGGYFSGDEFYTYKGTLNDDTLIKGELIEEICASDGRTYCLVVSQYGCERFVFIGYYAGTDHENTPEEVNFWWPTPVPRVLSEEIYQLYGVADMVSADFLEYPDGIH